MTESGEIVPADIPAVDISENDWELAAQWNRAWQKIKLVGSLIIVLGFLIVVGEGFLLFQTFWELHPVFGLLFLGTVSGLLYYLVGRPLLSFFSTPVMAEPPSVHFDSDVPTADTLEARLKFDVKYLKAMRANPALSDRKSEIAESILMAQAMLERAKVADMAAAKAMVAEIVSFEKEHIETRLAGIDASVDRMIHNEAVAIGVATAVSMNGTIDAFIVLWRNANLVSKVARAYFGRPHLKGSLLILRDVAGVVVMARVLEDVTEVTGEVIGSLLGRMGGLVAGPVMDGGINAMMTLKLGYLAKQRCRSFETWTPEVSRSISAKVLQRVKAESGSVASDLLKKVGGITSVAAKAASATMQGSRNAWSLVQSWFGFRKSANATADNAASQ